MIYIYITVYLPNLYFLPLFNSSTPCLTPYTLARKSSEGWLSGLASAVYFLGVASKLSKLRDRFSRTLNSQFQAPLAVAVAVSRALGRVRTWTSD